MAAEIARIALAAVLLAGGLGKLTDRKASRESVAAFGVANIAAGAVSNVLIAAELLIATALFFGPWPKWAAASALALLAIVSVAVAANLIHGRRPECHCFGRLSRGPIDVSTLARNGGLAALAGYVAGGGHEPLPWLGLALVLAAAWLAWRAWPRGSRSTATALALPLHDAAGKATTLEELRGRARPVLLVFSQPGCGACQALIGKLSDWHDRFGDRLTIAVASDSGTAGADGAASEPTGYPVLRDRTGALASAYGVTATPSAVLIKPSGNLAAPMALGADEIEGLLMDRLGHDDSPRLKRRALILRAGRGATTLGALPLLAAACGSSKSSSSATSSNSPAATSSTTSTTATAARPKSLRAGAAYICGQRYALCTNSACRPSPHDPNTVICDCVVKGGYSVGLTPCSHRTPHGTTIYSTFSTELVTSTTHAMTCGADVPWANCLDAPCRLDPTNPDKAICYCPLVKTGPSFTLGGGCNTKTCGKTVWSGAHSNVGTSAVAAAMKRVGQPLANLSPCPKA